MNIKYKTCIDASGYSQCAQDYILALSKKHNLKLIPEKVSLLLDGKGIDYNQRLMLQDLIKNNINNNEPYINICHSVPERFIIDPKAKLNIGYTVCETEIIPNKWSFLCNKMDAIFTASEYCKDIFARNGVTKPIYVIPHCHNVEKFSNVGKYNINNLSSFNFLFVADMTPRKGWHDLIQAYCEEFNEHDDVSLTLKVYFGDFSINSQNNCKTKVKEYAKSLGYELNKNTAKVLFYGHCLPSSCMLRFINTFDCLVSPHRGEGWGLNLSQAMLLKKPVIGSNYSGNLEFMNTNNSFLIPMQKETKPIDPEMISINPNYANLNWPVVNKDELRKILRYVFENKKHARDIGYKGYQDISEKYNYDVILNKIDDAILNLLNEK